MAFKGYNPSVAIEEVYAGSGEHTLFRKGIGILKACAKRTFCDSEREPQLPAHGVQADFLSQSAKGDEVFHHDSSSPCPSSGAHVKNDLADMKSNVIARKIDVPAQTMMPVCG